MKNIYQIISKNLSNARKNLKNLTSEWLSSIKKGFSFYNRNTELLAIWTVLFLTITGLFVLAINSNILVILLLFIFAIAIMFAGTLAAAYYLHTIKYRKQKQFVSKAHNILNKSFKLRSLISFIRIPHISILNTLAKNFRLAS